MNRRPMIVVSIAVIAVMLLASAWAWTQLPPDAQVAIHWNLAGEADGYAGKTIGLFLLPIVAAGVAVLLALIPRFEPRRANLERSGKAYGATWIGVMLLLGVLHLLSVSVALGADLNLTGIVLVGTGVLFVVIGNYLPKVRPNYMMGIRTPWTLTSDLSWSRTHRIGGRMFVVWGLFLAVLGLVCASSEALLIALIGGLVVLLAVLFPYSYQVWKTDPERRPA